MCCLKCPEDISRGWTESIASLRSTKLISSHSPHNNWQDVLGKIATSNPQLTHNSCLFPQRHALKRHLLRLVLVQRVKFSLWAGGAVGSAQGTRDLRGDTAPGCPRLGAGLSRVSGSETSCSGFHGFSPSPPGPWLVR